MTDSTPVSSPLPGCEAVWQKTLGLANFDPAVLEHERVRNARPAYGLTLVVDYPLPGDLLANVEPLRRICRQVLGNGVELYPDDHLHLTVYSLARSRTDPFPEKELAAVWSRWLPRLQAIAGDSPPLAVSLRGLAITWNGAVMVCGAASAGLRELQAQVSRLPGVAAPRDVPPHITIGQLQHPSRTSEDFGQAMAALHRHAADPVGTLHSTRLQILYYYSRLLDEIGRSTEISLRRNHYA